MNSRIQIAATVVLVAAVVGCDQMETKPTDSSAIVTNRVVEGDCASLSADMRDALKMRSSLDAGDFREALVGARRLMHSPERDVRSEVLTVLSWIGKRTMPELSEMMRDPDSNLAHEALSGWEQAFDELNYDFERSKQVLMAVSNLTERSFIDAVLMKVDELDESSALPILEQVILKSKGLPAAICAKEMFKHIAGEAWSSTNRTQKIIHSLKQ